MKLILLKVKFCEGCNLNNLYVSMLQVCQWNRLLPHTELHLCPRPRRATIRLTHGTEPARIPAFGRRPMEWSLRIQHIAIIHPAVVQARIVRLVLLHPLRLRRLHLQAAHRTTRRRRLSDPFVNASLDRSSRPKKLITLN